MELFHCIDTARFNCVLLFSDVAEAGLFVKKETLLCVSFIYSVGIYYVLYVFDISNILLRFTKKVFSFRKFGSKICFEKPPNMVIFPFFTINCHLIYICMHATFNDRNFETVR